MQNESGGRERDASDLEIMRETLRTLSVSIERAKRDLATIERMHAEAAEALAWLTSRAPLRKAS